MPVEIKRKCFLSCIQPLNTFLLLFIPCAPLSDLKVPNRFRCYSFIFIFKYVDLSLLLTIHLILTLSRNRFFVVQSNTILQTCMCAAQNTSEGGSLVSPGLYFILSCIHRILEEGVVTFSHMRQGITYMRPVLIFWCPVLPNGPSPSIGSPTTPLQTTITRRPSCVLEGSGIFHAN
jgi:hypothetical protein